MLPFAKQLKCHSHARHEEHVEVIEIWYRQGHVFPLLPCQRATLWSTASNITGLFHPSGKANSDLHFVSTQRRTHIMHALSQLQPSSIVSPCSGATSQSSPVLCARDAGHTCIFGKLVQSELFFPFCQCFQKEIQKSQERSTCFVTNDPSCSCSSGQKQLIHSADRFPLQV